MNNQIMKMTPNYEKKKYTYFTMFQSLEKEISWSEGTISKQNYRCRIHGSSNSKKFPDYER